MKFRTDSYQTRIKSAENTPPQQQFNLRSSKETIGSYSATTASQTSVLASGNHESPKTTPKRPEKHEISGNQPGWAALSSPNPLCRLCTSPFSPHLRPLNPHPHHRAKISQWSDGCEQIEGIAWVDWFLFVENERNLFRKNNQSVCWFWRRLGEFVTWFGE